MKHLIAPSVLAADFSNLQRDLKMLNASQAEWIHVDVMDGMFVPNISFGFPVMEAIRKHTSKPLDVHLMIADPDRYIERFAAAGASVITVHLEACTHLHRTLEAIRQAGCRAGVALNPHTPVSLLEDVLAELDLVLIMSVNPGFGGQKFIENTYKKIADLRRLATGWPDLVIEVDGGVDVSNIGRLAQVGAHAFVAGSAVFSATDPAAKIAELNQAAAHAYNIQA